MLERIRRFTHDHLGWAYPLRGTECFPYMGISERATCRFCGGRLLRSSQGWFHADDVKVKLRCDEHFLFCPNCGAKVEGVDE